MSYSKVTLAIICSRGVNQASLARHRSQLLTSNLSLLTSLLAPLMYGLPSPEGPPWSSARSDEETLISFSWKFCLKPLHTAQITSNNRDQPKKLRKKRLFYSLIAKLTLAKRQWSDLTVLESSCHSNNLGNRPQTSPNGNHSTMKDKVAEI